MPRRAKPIRWTAVERNIEQRNNLVRVRMRVDGRTEYEYFALDQLSEARERRDHWASSIRRGRRVLSAVERKVTVGAMADAYLAAHHDVWRPRSRDQYRANWNAMRPAFGDKPVIELQASDVSDWLAAETARFAPNTVSNRLWLLRSILDRAAADYDIPNKARLVKRPRKVGGQPRKKRVLSNTDVNKLIAEATPRYRLAWRLALALGLRSSEIRGLTLDRVDADAGTLTLDRQLLRTHGDVADVQGIHLGGRHWLAPLKAENSYAVLNIGPRLLDEIDEHVRLFGTGPAGLIITGHQSQPLSDERWSHEIARARDATGIAMVGHDLRRTFGHHVLAGDESNIAKVAGALRNDTMTAQKAYIRPQRDERALSDDILDSLDESAACTSRAHGRLRAV